MVLRQASLRAAISQRGSTELLYFNGPFFPILTHLGCEDPRPPKGQMPLTYGPVPDIA
jgi:hypothetical protein